MFIVLTTNMAAFNCHVVVNQEFYLAYHTCMPLAHHKPGIYNT